MSSRRGRPNSAELSDCFQRASSSDAEALQQLLAFCRPLLLKLAQRQVTGVIRAKIGPSDVVQATVWKATQNFESQQFADRKGFLAWLVTILKNETADERRRFQTAQKRDVSRERPLHCPETRQWLQRLSASLCSMENARSQKLADIEQLLESLTKLPPHYQLVLRLRYYERLTFESIGTKLDRSADAARVLHNRALQKLRAELIRESETSAMISEQ